MSNDSTHPLKKIVRAREVLEASKADLLVRSDRLIGYEKEYVAILDGLVAMMKSAEQAHWFKVTGDNTWSTRDKWKLNALDVATKLLGEDDDKDTRD